LVSIMPSAFLPCLSSFSPPAGVFAASSIEPMMSASMGGCSLEPAGRDRAGGDEHALADAAAEHVERDQRPAALDLDLEEGPVADLVDPLRRPARSRSPWLSASPLLLDLDSQAARAVARHGRQHRTRRRAPTGAPCPRPRARGAR
jgi:hypothetical protein